MQARNLRLALILSFAVGLAVCACDSGRVPSEEDSGRQSAGAGEDPGTMSPAEIVSRLGTYHVARDYDRIGPLIAADRREETIAFLRAVDEVLDNNTRLRQVAEERLGKLAADAWNLSALEDNLGVFSARTHLINQTFKGKTALVTLQEGENVPLVRPSFVLTDEGWKYQPPASPDGMVAALRGLAEILADVTTSLEEGAGVEDYVRDFVDRVWPQMNRVVAAGQGGDRRVSVAAEVP